MRTAVPAERVTVVTSPARYPGTVRASVARSLALTLATVGAEVAGRDSRRIALSLSVNVTAPPAVVRAQPSGTFTEYPAPGGE